MDTLSIDTSLPDREEGSGHPCHGSFLLGKIQRGKADKLGNRVEEILWCGADYIVYRTCQGVFVHFADDDKKQRRQRHAFNKICPELCELRYLTHEMRRKKKSRHLLRRMFRLFRKADETASGGADESLFEHNMAQAIMLLMEGDQRQAELIAKEALKMAVTRCTNDNTIRYVGASILAAILAGSSCLAVLAALVIFPAADLTDDTSASLYFVAALFGVLGAAFSVITRVLAFRMKPCQQSNMNYMMAWTRIAVGLIAGLMLYLLLAQQLFHAAINQVLLQDWRAVAVIGFLSGFAERLVPTVFQRTAASLEDSSGTPVQAARRSEGHSPALP